VFAGDFMVGWKRPRSIHANAILVSVVFAWLDRRLGAGFTFPRNLPVDWQRPRNHVQKH